MTYVFDDDGGDAASFHASARFTGVRPLRCGSVPGRHIGLRLSALQPTSAWMIPGSSVPRPSRSLTPCHDPRQRQRRLITALASSLLITLPASPPDPPWQGFLLL